MAAALAERAFEILLVDDDDGDIMIIEEALAERELNRGLTVAHDGVDALEILHDPDRTLPDLIILDLNMPRMNGRELLAEIKNDRSLRHIPVVVLTTSEAADDVLSSYALHANAYVTKPAGFEEFASRVREIEDFYLGLVRLPGRWRPGLQRTPDDPPHG
jgi:CheY-like chemotaxis protein